VECSGKNGREKERMKWKTGWKIVLEKEKKNAEKERRK
jgi:hypothetical protein